MTEQETTTAKKKGTTYTTIKMDDGRTVDFPGETKALKNFVSTDEGKVIGRIDFVNGKTLNIDIGPEKVELLLLAAAHGLSQKLGDSYSALKDPDDMFTTAQNLATRLNEQGAEGWRQARAAGAGDAGIGLLVKALMEVTSADEEAVRKYLEGLDATVKKALREADPTVAPVYKRLKDERDAAKPKPKVDTAAALAGLQALAGGA